MNKEILEHLTEYLQQKIDSGEHKIFYNDLMYDEKIIDCINSVNDSLKEIERLNDECDIYMKIATQKQIKIDKAIKKLKFIDEYFSNNEILQMQQLIQNHKEVLEILNKGE